jgi:hypothetical protein
MSADNTNVVAIDIASNDGGRTLDGSMTYSSEGPIGFRGLLRSSGDNAGSNYAVENQWGGSSAPWHPGGTWVIGARGEQMVVGLDVASHDNGATLVGTNTYAGEGPIGFKGSRNHGKVYDVENQWGGSGAEWHPGGAWLLGARGDKPQHVVAIEIVSADGGQTFTGSMTYAGEGPIGFKATNTVGNGYAVENQWGGSSAPWHPGGQWLIGGRNQKCVAVHIRSDDGGKTFTGTMTYVGEGPIGFRAKLAGGDGYDAQNQWGGSSAPWHPGGVWILGCR